MRVYQSYKSSGNEWIGEIPKHWEVYRLGMLGTFSSSGIDKNSNDNEVSVRMVNFTDLVQGKNHYPIQNGEKEYMRVTTPDSKLREHRLNKGDMVFIPSSETEVDLGYSSLIDFEEDDIVYSYHILRFRFNKEVYHFYKKYLVNHYSVLNQFSSEGKGTTRQIIGRNVFNNVRVVLPPLHEQQQIVQFLDEKTELIDKLISTKERKISLLKEQRTSLINQVITKGLNPNVKMKDSGVEWIGEIPEHWMLVPLKYLSDFQNGFGFKSELWTDIGIPIIRIQNLNGGDNYNFYSYDKNYEKYEVTKGDLLYSWSGNVGTSFGPFLWNKEGTYYLNQHIFLVKPKIEINVFWYFNVLKQMTKYVEEYFTTGVIGLVHITKDELGCSRIPLPPINEQNEIVNYLNSKTKEIDDMVQLEQKKIDLLKEYRKSLISEIVTGKIKVTTDE